MNIVVLLEATIMLVAAIIGARRWSRVNKAGKYIIAGVGFAFLDAASRFLAFYGAIKDADWGVMVGQIPILTFLFVCGSALLFLMGLWQMRG